MGKKGNYMKWSDECVKQTVTGPLRARRRRRRPRPPLCGGGSFAEPLSRGVLPRPPRATANARINGQSEGETWHQLLKTLWRGGRAAPPARGYHLGGDVLLPAMRSGARPPTCNCPTRPYPSMGRLLFGAGNNSIKCDVFLRSP